MKCIFCKSDTSVEITRPNLKGPFVWRRRQCGACGQVFSTRERPSLSLAMTVNRKAGGNEPFSEDKLFISIYQCLSHRKDALEASRALSETIVRLLLPRKSRSVESTEIKTAVLKVLKRFDRAALTYYKAHHK